MERPDVLIAKVIGQPIDAALPTPVVIAEIANVETAEPGEDVYCWDSDAGYDTNSDTLYTAGDAGEMVSNKKSPVSPSALTFVGLQSDLAYVTVNQVLNSKDQTALARKKAAITRGMDKEEVARLITLLIAVDIAKSQTVVLTTGEDLYDGILEMVHKIEDYGDNYVLLCGKTVKEKIDTYDKDHSDNFNYRIGMKETLANLGVKVIKLVGSVGMNSAGAYTTLIGANAAIMVALNSQLVAGKPCLFVRRKISPEIAAGMGIEPENAVRLVSVAQTPTVINNHKNILGYGVFGYEMVIEAVTNYLATVYCADLVTEL